MLRMSNFGQESDPAAIVIPRLLCYNRYHIFEFPVNFGVFHLMTSLFDLRWSDLACLIELKAIVPFCLNKGMCKAQSDTPSTMSLI